MTDPIEDFMNDESIPANFRTALLATVTRSSLSRLRGLRTFRRGFSRRFR